MNTNATPDPLPDLAWAPLAGESKEDYQEFLGYLCQCIGIAAKLTRADAQLNLEILPLTRELDEDLVFSAWQWRERVPSWFIYVGNALQQRLANEKAGFEG